MDIISCFLIRISFFLLLPKVFLLPWWILNEVHSVRGPWQMALWETEALELAKTRVEGRSGHYSNVERDILRTNHSKCNRRGIHFGVWSTFQFSSWKKNNYTLKIKCVTWNPRVVPELVNHFSSRLKPITKIGGYKKAFEV